MNGELELSIRDSGIGFDPEVETNHGLGIVSMQERAGLAGGTIAIVSKPSAGTEIKVRVPIGPNGVKESVSRPAIMEL